MEQHRICVQKTARYFTLGNFGPEIKTVLFVCHGYAQLANEFLEQFNSILRKDLLIVAPEGLHRFYQRGGQEKIVASWMTKVDREDDIRDYVFYLDQVRDEVLAKIPSDVKVFVLGFSQGAATVSRWVVLGNKPIDELILWCGFIPPDLGATEIPATTNLTVVTASDDKFISPEQEKEQLTIMNKLSSKMKHIRFEGQHVIDQKTLLEFFGTH